MAIVAYALAVRGSSKADIAYKLLMSMKLEEDGKVYWGRSDIKTNRVRYEYNRPFLEAKDYQNDDALAVEATGYALLTMFLIEGGGVTVIQDQVQYNTLISIKCAIYFTTSMEIIFFSLLPITRLSNG